MAVKVPPLLHKMSLTAQKAWYKKHGMGMPTAAPADELKGRSAAAAKRVKVAPRKTIEVDPNSVRAINAARQQAYMAKGGRQPIGAMGSGGSNVMAGAGQSTIKDLKASIKAGFNPKVSLDPYEGERAKKTGPRSLNLKKESVDEAMSPEAARKRRILDLKMKMIKKVANKPALNKPSKFADKPSTAMSPRDDMKLEPKAPSGKGGHYYDEAAKPDASMAMTDTLKMKMISDKDKMTLGKIADLMSAQKNKDKKNAFVRQLGLKAMKAGEVDPARGHSPTRFGREVLRKEEFEQIDEVTKKEAEQTLGGPVKEKPKMSPGKQPAGYRYVRGLARKAMKAGLKKEEVEVNEAIKDAADVGEYDYEGDMAKSQLRSILANAKRLHDMLEDQTNLPEWVQSKITLAEDYILTAANYMEGEMNEEVEQVDEKIDLVKAKMSDVVKDFYKSKAPQFKGKSMAKRREMAVAAKLGAEREAGMREEVEQVDEVKAVKAYDKEGKLVGRYRSMDHAKQMKPGHTYKVEEEAEKVTEAEGKLAVTPKEKELAAHHGDKTRITFGDVLKARLKSAAEKAMKKGN